MTRRKTLPTRKQAQDLKRLVDQGMTRAEICRELDLSETVGRNLLSICRLHPILANVRGQNVMDAHEPVIREMIAQGKTLGMICKAINTNHRTLLITLKRLGIETGSFMSVRRQRLRVVLDNNPPETGFSFQGMIDKEGLDLTRKQLIHQVRSYFNADYVHLVKADQETLYGKSTKRRGAPVKILEKPKVKIKAGPKARKVSIPKADVPTTPQQAPEIAHPFWSCDLDDSLRRTEGAYSSISNFALKHKLRISEVQARYHRVAV
jgi:hypothetical protein